MSIFLFYLTVSCAFAVDSEEAQVAINRAESKLNVAYNAVSDAERAGANVTELLSMLNNSSMLLSDAHMQYRIGNFSQTVNLANQCYDSLNAIDTEAHDLREHAAMLRKQSMLFSAVASIYAIGVVLFGSIFSWRFFKSKYYRRVLKMKPEVQVDES